MVRRTRLLLISLVLIGLAGAATCTAKEIIDPEEAKADPDFAVQGEYLGEGTLTDGTKDKVGAQVIALGGGQFRAVIYKGGLPGAGWKRGDERFSMEGKADDLKGRKLLGKIAQETLTISDESGKPCIEMKRTERKGPTLEAKAPAGAVVLFDGTGLDAFTDHPQLSTDKCLISGETTKQEFNDYTLHLEFRLSWMPDARGQGRSNSGVYAHDCYEIQVLDSFGLEGEDNECGGFYSIRKPDVNMCLPPMTWQTYDIDFTAPKFQDGNKVANARITLRHNGVVIHDCELPRGTPGRKAEGPGPRPIHIQGHGNKVLYRNIWVLEKKA